MKYYTTFLVCTLLFSLKTVSQTTYGTGLIFDDSAYSKAPVLSPALKFAETKIPEKYSLKKYCPTPGNQGYMGSCVSWSCGYACLTISFAIKHNLTYQSEIDKNAKSALFIYNQVKRPDSKDLCDVGINIEDAIRFLMRNGDCEFKNFNPKYCDVSPSQEIRNEASEFVVDSYNKLFEINDSYERKIYSVIQSLIQNKPVVGGFVFVKSLYKLNKMNAIWKPRPEEVPEGGHAMCIVGYDNVRQEFEIQNSWGADFANDGFFTMSYRDFAEYCKYGYNLKLGLTKEELAKMTNLSGKFYFKKFVRFNEQTQKSEFQTVQSILSDGHYTFTNGSVKKNDFYRLVSSNMQQGSFLYLFSLKPDKTYEILFPLSASKDSIVNDIPLISNSNAYIELPVDNENAYSTDMIGEDVLCLLYTNQKIDNIKKLVEKINTASGDIYNRLTTILGSRLIPSKNINYSNSEISFSTLSKEGNIVPIILKVNVSQ